MFFKAIQPQKPNTDQKMVLKHQDFTSLKAQCSHTAALAYWLSDLWQLTRGALDL